MPSSTTRRMTATTAILAGGLMLSTNAVSAQSRCGATYEVAAGDTLYSISQSCRVSLARIMDLNPSLGNPRDISVGTRLQLVAGDDAAQPRDDVPRGGERYEVQAGDTLYSIARRFGVSVLELISENGELDPSQLDIGEIIGIPDDRPAATVEVSPRSGTAGTRVTVSASNLRPDDYVTIGAGRRAAEWQALREVQVDSDGDLQAEVALPDYADAGDTLIFVVDTDRGVTFKSDPFDVVAERSGRLSLEGRVEAGAECPELVTPDGDRYALAGDTPPVTIGEYVEITGTEAPAFCAADLTTVDVRELREVSPPEGGNGGVTLEGRVRPGTECPVLVAPGGDRYALTGEDVDGAIGEYVEIDGTRAGMSFCMEGRSTIQVTDLREVSPPEDGQQVTVDYMKGAWAAKGGDCDRSDFDVSNVPGGGLAVETSLDGAPRTDRVETGATAAFIFDSPHRELELERRGVDGVAVLPPQQGAIELGGRRISGDGRVFVKCG
ncbi:LysM peptidoglycan-binding domain-containing protein [Marinovum sp.]|uniref:LysM peptidoglycan-binding domain-containing protein n=1 Tax=Marinovum sp. TaxID=2024839 RepID=UPI002B26D2E1|nr:LysM peptidoglycan-binding domain-containing protein [Marinovum sp.]